MLISTKQLKSNLSAGNYDASIGRIHTDVDAQKLRMAKAVDAFEDHFGPSDCAFIITAPGRTEVAGNHTDHQQGIVLAASVSLDTVAIVAKRDDMKVGLYSEGYRPFTVDISDLSVKEEEKGTTAALIRGVAAGFKNRELNVGGFDFYVTSDVLSGSGLSSSACFEVLTGSILAYLYNDDSVAPYKIAMIGQYAENVYFGKPCGLMDQMACAIGGLIRIDFADKNSPDFGRIPFEVEKYGYRLCIVDTGGSHADLTDDYASITVEMKAVAKELSAELLSGVDENEFWEKIPELRRKLGDRAVLRASHYLDEIHRVDAQRECLEKGDFDGFLSLVKASGRSSYMYLQNAYSVKSTNEQGVCLGLRVCEKILGDRGAYRLHGGGFAGTIQCYVPEDLLSEFKKKTEAVFGEGKCYILNVRQSGAVVIS